jgi:hypothetical protein
MPSVRAVIALRPTAEALLLSPAWTSLALLLGVCTASPAASRAADEISSSSNCLTMSAELLLLLLQAAALRLAGLDTSAGVGEKLGILDGDGDWRSSGMAAD